MLRQANDQLERTMNERQELEDSVKEANEETTAKVKLISLMDLVKNKSVDRLNLDGFTCKLEHQWAIQWGNCSNVTSL